MKIHQFFIFVCLAVLLFVDLGRTQVGMKETVQSIYESAKASFGVTGKKSAENEQQATDSAKEGSNLSDKEIMKEEADNMKRKTQEGETTATRAKERVKEHIERFIHGAKQTAEKAKEGAEYVTEKAEEGAQFLKETAAGGMEYAKETVSDGMEAASDTVRRGAEYIKQKAGETMGKLSEKTQDLTMAAKEKGEALKEGIKETIEEPTVTLFEKIKQKLGFGKTEKTKEKKEYKKHIEEALKHIQIALERLHEEV